MTRTVQKVVTCLKSFLVKLLTDKNREILDIEDKYRSGLNEPTSKYEKATKESWASVCGSFDIPNPPESWHLEASQRYILDKRYILLALSKDRRTNSRRSDPET